jgi:3-carboxy-cis,cis-muconate cycloisomerase
MRSRLIDGLTTTDALADVFSDLSFIESMLAFEAALARVEARLGIIPDRAARDIVHAAGESARFDAAAMARATRQSATPGVPLVAALTERVRAIDEWSARFVHVGATSQDVVDTALILTISRAQSLLDADHVRLTTTLRALSESHASSVMLGRTLLQPAPPVTFGLKAAGWFAAEHRAWRQLAEAFDRTRLLQFGGASGTLAALGEAGPEVSRALADELGLTSPEAPWHTSRDRLAGFVTACGVYAGVLGKIARDISLLMQHEVSEVSEAGGGSSTMPHKRNPSGSAIVLAAASRLPGLVATFLGDMIQEHERAVGGWQAEVPTVAAAVQATGSALAALADAMAHLTVSPARMRENLDATRGLVYAERVMIRASALHGRDHARRLVDTAIAESRSTGATFGDIVRATPELVEAMGDAVQDFDRPEHYLGAAESLRVALLASAS